VYASFSLHAAWPGSASVEQAEPDYRRQYRREATAEMAA